MAKNELIVGEPRLGWFVDGRPDTERVPVMLRDTGSVIELTIALNGFGGDGPYDRWWSSGVMYGDDPDRTKHSYSPPRVLLVEDTLGTVVLVGCRAASSISSFNVGQGRIIANLAVLGGSSLDYEQIHGLRTEIPALAAWTRLGSMELQTKTDDKHRVQSVQMTLTSTPPIPLASSMNLSLRSSWRTNSNHQAREFVAREGVEIETLVPEAQSWDDHLDVHRAILDLISIAAWESFGFAALRVDREDERAGTATGDDLGPRWLDVVTHRLPEHKAWAKEPRFLFPYGEVGASGVETWLELRDDYGRVIGPLLTVLRSDNPWSHASVVQSGIALEALGYLIDVKKNGGAHLNSRKQMNFKPGLEVILADMEITPLSDPEDWIRRADASYMSAKHLDRAEPDSLETANTLRETLLVLRYWIALQLGVTAASLTQGFTTDRLAHQFSLAE